MPPPPNPRRIAPRPVYLFANLPVDSALQSAEMMLIGCTATAEKPTRRGNKRPVDKFRTPVHFSCKICFDRPRDTGCWVEALVVARVGGYFEPPGNCHYCGTCGCECSHKAYYLAFIDSYTVVFVNKATLTVIQTQSTDAAGELSIKLPPRSMRDKRKRVKPTAAQIAEAARNFVKDEPDSEDDTPRRSRRRTMAQGDRSPSPPRYSRALRRLKGEPSPEPSATPPPRRPLMHEHLRAIQDELDAHAEEKKRWVAERARLGPDSAAVQADQRRYAADRKEWDRDREAFEEKEAEWEDEREAFATREADWKRKSTSFATREAEWGRERASLLAQQKAWEREKTGHVAAAAESKAEMAKMQADLDKFAAVKRLMDSYLPAHLKCPSCRVNKLASCDVEAFKVAQAGGYFHRQRCHNCYCGHIRCMGSTRNAGVFIAFRDFDTVVLVDQKTKEIVKMDEGEDDDHDHDAGDHHGLPLRASSTPPPQPHPTDDPPRHHPATSDIKGETELAKDDPFASGLRMIQQGINQHTADKAEWTAEHERLLSLIAEMDRNHQAERVVWEGERAGMAAQKEELAALKVENQQLKAQAEQVNQVRGAWITLQGAFGREG
ncbi:uncharacterized protein LOC62_05G006790 [Vanrija pseudolonga]|uniref:Uncharacterized protein n=1 Tax=Vanrija pseudolonga TaxID=143232 RepID=A0AAF1BSC2_9TREE|nr:hypothetical protein LOC62_05G006790 [Vanrija pseudolonga]